MLKSQIWDLGGGLVSKNSPARTRDTGRTPRKIPRALEQLSPCTTAAEARGPGAWAPQERPPSEKPAPRSGEWPPLAATRESLQEATKAQRTESQSEAAQSCPTLRDPRDCSPPGSSVHGTFQARGLEWVAISFSRGSSWPRDWTMSPASQADPLPAEPPGKPPDPAQPKINKIIWKKKLNKVLGSWWRCPKAVKFLPFYRKKIKYYTNIEKIKSLPVLTSKDDSCYQ